MSQRPAVMLPRVSVRLAMSLHRRHAIVLAELGGRWNDSLPAQVRRTLLRMLHQKQALIERDVIR